MSRSVLVTGGAGFIGSHVCERLLSRGDEVICLDNLDDYYDPAIKRSHLHHLSALEGFTSVTGDIRDPQLLEHIARNHRIDGIIHLAARAGVRPSIQEPALYVDVNLNGTTQLLEMARNHSIDHFVFASSSSVYGDRNEVPFRETDPVDQPVSPYAATKKAGEVICHAFHHLHDINIFCLRYFTVYGPRQRPEMAIHRFTSMIQQGQAIPMFGDGSMERDFTYIDDIVTGTISALDRVSGFEILNLGNHRSIRLDGLIELIGKSCGLPVEIDRLPAPAGDVSRTCASIDKANQFLGYSPQTSIEDGVEKFVSWFNAQQQKNKC
ncbi:MAG: NAD-dependent epimerase/dehydratase family protein [Planctomycetia bacterium]|nr:NAD-dependent epimerase/dehydratase family protein [Planctomycetia bacterium]NCG13962.1 NAD-dependent epimerase/dehydratase family protein [Planctomycetia bacterium]NCG56132.1 NAD-dependent epimerase/dehydratase family protein [Pseudomonadota bacterium]